jgi:hypothetical protein
MLYGQHGAQNTKALYVLKIKSDAKIRYTTFIWQKKGVLELKRLKQLLNG